MAPLVEAFPSSQLPRRSQISPQGKRRKGFSGDLKTCQLLELLQYKCEVEEPVTRESPTRCYPVLRLFRRCQHQLKDQQKSFLVETTAWEEENGK